MLRRAVIRLRAPCRLWRWLTPHGCWQMPPGRDVDAPFNYLAAKWHAAYADKCSSLGSL